MIFQRKASITRANIRRLLHFKSCCASYDRKRRIVVQWLTVTANFFHFSHGRKYDEGKTVDDEIEIVVQINGKIKDKLMIPAGLDKDGTQEAAMNTEKIKGLIEGKNVVKVIAVPGKHSI